MLGSEMATKYIPILKHMASANKTPLGGAAEAGAGAQEAVAMAKDLRMKALELEVVLSTVATKAKMEETRKHMTKKLGEADMHGS